MLLRISLLGLPFCVPQILNHCVSFSFVWHFNMLIELHIVTKKLKLKYKLFVCVLQHFILQDLYNIKFLYNTILGSRLIALFSF